MFNLNPQKINFDEVLREDDFGSFHPYQKDAQNDQWTVKFTYVSNIDRVLDSLQEIVLGFSSDHPAIVPVKGYYIEKAQPKGFNIYMKLPRLEGCLQDELTKRRLQGKPFSEEEIVKYFHSLASGIEYLHAKKIAHGDITPFNIHLDRHGGVRLTGIGRKFTTSTGQNQDKAKIPLETSNPERIMKKKEFYKVDCWGLGMTIVELCLLKNSLVILSGSQDEREAAIKDMLQQVQDRYGKCIVEVLSGLLQGEPNKTVTAEEARKKLEEGYPDIVGSKVRLSQNELDKQMESLLQAYKSLGLTPPQLQKIGVEIPLQNQQIDLKMLNMKKVFTVSKSVAIEERKLDETSTNMRKLELIKDELNPKWSEAFPLKVNEEKKELKISGSYRWTNDTMIKDFMTELNKKMEEKGVQNLNSLILNFRMCRQVTDLGLSELAEQIGPNFRNLQVLFVNFEHCTKISDTGVKEFVTKILPNQKELRYLSIEYQHCLLEDSAIIHTISAITLNLKQLVYLALNFTWNQNYTDNGVLKLATEIGTHLKNLQHLSIEFGSAKITQRGIKEMITQVATHLTQLRQLTLHFLACKQISFEENAALKKMLEHIPNRNVRF